MSDRIEHPVQGSLLDDAGEIIDSLDTVWRYDPERPHYVVVEFEAGTVWKFPRSLLGCGVVAPAGLGDVRFTPQAGMVRMFLDGDIGEATAVFYSVDLCDFLDAAYTAVPEGAEAIDVDAGIALLLSPTFRSAVR